MNVSKLAERMIRRYGPKACIELALRMNDRRPELSRNQLNYVFEMHMYLLKRLNKQEIETVHDKAMSSAIKKAS